MEEIPETRRRRLLANLEAVQERIRDALSRAGRPLDAARLVAVTKSVDPPVARALISLGQRDLGENRPETVAARKAAVGPDAAQARWHMIGTYQRRKIRDTLDLFDLVHSVHKADLLEALGRQAAAANRKSAILLQVNVSGEGSKQGFTPEELGPALESAERHDNLVVQGLMTMAPVDAGPDALRRLFARTRALRDAHAAPGRELPELSMGMSRDFEEALMEGATLVRVGTALFEGLREA